IVRLISSQLNGCVAIFEMRGSWRLRESDICPTKKRPRSLTGRLSTFLNRKQSFLLPILSPILSSGMHHITFDWLRAFIANYGYWAVALALLAESAGLPVPGEITLLVASVIA